MQETVLQFWNIEKRKCEERKLELRTKAQQKDALKEKQEFDLKVLYLFLPPFLPSLPSSHPTHYSLVVDCFLFDAMQCNGEQLHKQKVMYLLQEQQAAATDKHIDGENALKLAQDNERSFLPSWLSALAFILCV